jgi:hypothetical protein
MKTATTALGAILASIAILVRVRSAGSRRHEARPTAGQGSPQGPRDPPLLWWIGAPSALWRRGRKQEIEPSDAGVDGHDRNLFVPF